MCQINPIQALSFYFLGVPFLILSFHLCLGLPSRLFTSGFTNKTPECIVGLKSDGTRWHTGREVKGKLANGVGSQYSSHYLGTWCIQHYYRWCAHLGCQQSTELTPPADLNGLVRFGERRNLVSARVPSRCKRTVPLYAPFAPQAPIISLFFVWRPGWHWAVLLWKSNKKHWCAGHIDGMRHTNNEYIFL